MITLDQIREAVSRIDEELSRDGVPIHARPMKAATMIGGELGVSGFPLLNSEASPNWKTDNSHIWPVLSDWYESRYGDRTKVDRSFGRVVVLLRGTAWTCEIPYMIGTVHIYMERGGIDSMLMGPEDRLRSINGPDCLEGMTPDLRKTLTDSEMEEIATALQLGYSAFLTLEELGDHHLLHAARRDFASAVDHLAGGAPHCGQSRWSSLQAAEKVVKMQLDRNGVEYPKTHRLEKLSELLTTAGLPPIPRDLLETIQCEADVRYNDSGVTRGEAIAAHYGSLRMVALFANRSNRSRDGGGSRR